MSWTELNQATREQLPMTREREVLLNEVKHASRPALVKEVDQGKKEFEPIRFFEVRSPYFEAEFGQRYNDIVFHFWPHGFKKAEEAGAPRPAFLKGMQNAIRTSLIDTFGDSSLVKVSQDQGDRELGAIYAKVERYGARQFWFELSKKAVTNLHKSLGGV